MQMDVVSFFLALWHLPGLLLLTCQKTSEIFLEIKETKSLTQQTQNNFDRVKNFHDQPWP